MYAWLLSVHPSFGGLAESCGILNTVKVLNLKSGGPVKKDLQLKLGEVAVMQDSVEGVVLEYAMECTVHDTVLLWPTFAPGVVMLQPRVVLVPLQALKS